MPWQALACPDPMVRELACCRLRVLGRPALWSLPRLRELLRSGDNPAGEAARTIAAIKQFEQ